MNDIDFSQKLFEVIKFSGKSVNQVERECGFPRNSLHNYKINNREPSASRLLILAEYFGISPESLLGINLVSHQSVEDIFNKLNVEQKNEMAFVVQLWLLEEVKKVNHD